MRNGIFLMGRYTFDVLRCRINARDDGGFIFTDVVGLRTRLAARIVFNVRTKYFRVGLNDQLDLAG